MALDQVDVDKLDSKGRGEMSFMDHLESLRWHILRAFLAVSAGAAIVFMAKDFVFDKIIFGPKHADFPTYRILCSWGEALCFSPPTFEIITRDMGEKMNTHLVVSFMMGVILAFPYIFWEFWRFISPGLYDKERKAARGVVIICSLLFMIGVCFGYFVIAPFSIAFLAGYELAGTTTTATLSSYVDYLVMFTIPIGLVFEMPVVAYFLAKLGVVTADFLRQYRRIAFVVILIVAGIITPPDVVSQVIVQIPLYSLFEASIFVAARVEKRKKAQQLIDDALELEEENSTDQTT